MTLKFNNSVQNRRYFFAFSDKRRQARGAAQSTRDERGGKNAKILRKTINIFKIACPLLLKYHSCIYLITYLSISLFIHLFTYLFITYLFIHLFIHNLIFFHVFIRRMARVPRSPRSCPSSPKKTQKNIQLFFTYKKYLLHIYRP